MLLLIYMLAFLTVFLVTFTLASLWARRTRVKARFEGNPGEEVVSPFLRPKPAASPVKKKVMDWLSASGQWALKDPKGLSEIQERLIHAGYRHPQALAVFFGIRAMAAFLLPIPYILFYLIIKGKMGFLHVGFAFFLAFLGFFLPNYLLALKVRQRQNRLDKALPDILDLFVICMEAGLALNAALNKVAEEIKGVYPEFYTELQITAAELRTGIPWDEAFDNLGRRTGVQSIRSMVGLMIQSDKLGASIGQALRNHGDFTRTQRTLRAEENAAKLPLKLIFPLIFCIFPAMLIVSVGPAVIHVSQKLLPVFRMAR